MADDDQVCLDLFGNAGDLTSGSPDAQSRRRQEAHGREPLPALAEDILVDFDLFGDRECEPPSRVPVPAESSTTASRKTSALQNCTILAPSRNARRPSIEPS
jgi:hypothetical protein